MQPAAARVSRRDRAPHGAPRATSRAPRAPGTHPDLKQDVVAAVAHRDAEPDDNGEEHDGERAVAALEAQAQRARAAARTRAVAGQRQLVGLHGGDVDARSHWCGESVGSAVPARWTSGGSAKLPKKRNAAGHRGPHARRSQWRAGGRRTGSVKRFVRPRTTQPPPLRSAPAQQQQRCGHGGTSGAARACARAVRGCLGRPATVCHAGLRVAGRRRKRRAAVGAAGEHADAGGLRAPRGAQQQTPDGCGCVRAPPAAPLALHGAAAVAACAWAASQLGRTRAGRSRAMRRPGYALQRSLAATADLFGFRADRR